MTESLARKTKTALDESRTLMLGAQILLGFQLQAPFQTGFDRLAPPEKALELAALCLMTLVTAVLIAPSARHRIVENGEASPRFNSYLTRMAAFALAPFAVALAIDLSIALGRITDPSVGTSVAVAICIFAGVLWFGRHRRHKPERAAMTEATEKTSTSDKIRYVLTETRVVLPGAQALLGFQLMIVLTDAFATLPWFAKLMHAIALCLVALSTAFLIAPASVHRVAYGGDDSPELQQLASRFVLISTVLLAFGLGADMFVIAGKITDAWAFAAVLAGAATAMMLALWLIWPLVQRRNATLDRSR